MMFNEVIRMLKNRERIGTSLPKELVEKLRNHSDETMIPISKILEQALIEYLDKHAGRKQSYQFIIRKYSSVTSCISNSVSPLIAL